MYQNLEKFRLPEGFRGKPGWYVQLWWLIQTLFFKTSPQFMYAWRSFLLRLFGAKIGKNVIIRPSVHVQFPWKVEIGDHCWIGDNVTLYSLANIKIGKNSVVSQHSYLCAGTHDYLDSTFPIIGKEIIIEEECWVSSHVFVGPGVIIGKGTVIGARSSVFKSIPSNKICMGSPAQIIRDRIEAT